MAATNQNESATPPTAPPALSKAQVLLNVLSLATQFSTCVEAFNLIHPSKDSDRHQKVALAKLGLQQGRLLIFGDVVGISSPPATIARHMIPSHPGATNPDPHLPVNFGVRNPRLDEAGINEKVRAALDEIAGRPTHLSREDLMDKYGLKSPKRFMAIEYPALDTNRLEAFREKFGLLQDLVRQTGARATLKRGMSMTTQHWTVRDIGKFDEFVRTVRVEVDGLIALLGVKEQVDRGMRTDIKAFGWHPEMSGPIVRQDWEKLKLIQEACIQDYPEYVEITETALKYLSEELRGTSLANMRALHPSVTPTTPTTPTSPTNRASGESTKPKLAHSSKPAEKEKRPGFLSHLKSWAKSSHKIPRERTKSIASPLDSEDPQRSLSEDLRRKESMDSDYNGLEPVRSKSLSAVPDEHAPFNLDSRLESVATHDSKLETEPTFDSRLEAVPTHDAAAYEDIDPLDTNTLELANTANSLIDRHDMYKGVGRVETKDIRGKAHDWA
ncbi:hypothetical protein K505DRAFT_322328 [Melanomma pulvis-pyrius CBS 109.77]|uniref:Prion-inhibition and propagation HeLo domain-containing protein n=1 Tax=Melanomma pulvis-pyrius CBS 109.77 TaxID=1314802 RepID=A0A6A6XNJ3_9PLEO|nr:hypothetical protein K505DRAFT_322328 [Melanomma pulvis-pyrius CBS 109.77]